MPYERRMTSENLADRNVEAGTSGSKKLTAARTTELSVLPTRPCVADSDHIDTGQDLFGNPALGTLKLSAYQRAKISKALRVHAFRIYLRHQFSLAPLVAELAFLELCEFGLKSAIWAKHFLKYVLRRSQK